MLKHYDSTFTTHKDGEKQPFNVIVDITNQTTVQQLEELSALGLSNNTEYTVVNVERNNGLYNVLIAENDNGNQEWISRLYFKDIERPKDVVLKEVTDKYLLKIGLNPDQILDVETANNLIKEHAIHYYKKRVSLKSDADITVLELADTLATLEIHMDTTIRDAFN